MNTMGQHGIEELVEKYKSNRDFYLSSKYNEAQLRVDFLDPFFELLGWDIKNEKGKVTGEREVLLEESIKENAAANTKKPDYTFRLFSERKFFLEAKKPSVTINTDDFSAKQIRRYGFTARLKISVLSNFEYLAIYDCSNSVNANDSASQSRIKLYHYSEYVKLFESLQKELSYLSVYTGNFDKTWSHIEDQLRLFSVDTLFLQQINEWRLVLGKEVARFQTGISDANLNDIVQSYLNSIIFLRVCEDRNLEQYQTLLNFANNQDFTALIKRFQQADKKYNSGLFDHALTSELIKKSNSAFWTIIKQLYYPESTYSFSVFASDVLGSIYEIFLGYQLSSNGQKVTLEKKPEHIDRDVVTTPTFIIQDILRNTVMPFCKNKTDKTVLESKFGDIACGSGAFLMETYQALNDVLIDYYIQNAPQNLIQTSVNGYKLPFRIKRYILENCIYGIDRDFNAVEACKFGLLLKLLEDENNSTIPIPALPDLSKNILFGNSLIDSAKSEHKNENIFNPFDFGNIKFDVIVGNPPYMATEDMKQLTPLELPIYKKNYLSAYKQFDKYFLFIERSIELLKKGGYLGYIIPVKFTTVGSAIKLRTFLKKSKYIEKLISFGANQIFQNKTTYTCILVLQKVEHEKMRYIEIDDLSSWKVRKIQKKNFDEIPFTKLDDEGWTLVPAYLRPVYEKINQKSLPLVKIVGEENIYNGIQTSANNIYINIAEKEDDHYYYFTNGNSEWKVEKELTRPYYQTKGGVDSLNTYRPFKPNAFVIYPYQKNGESIEFVKLDNLKKNFPCVYRYLLAHKTQLANPKRDVKPTPNEADEWYRYGRHQSLDTCDVPAKIVVGVLSQGNKYAIDFNRTLISSGGTAGYCMITMPADCQYSIYYIQALLNSKYAEWFATLYGEIFRGGFIARGTKVLKKLPIRVINFENEHDKSIHDQITLLQKKLIETQTIVDKNIGNNRLQTQAEKKFFELKKEMEVLLKELFQLDEFDAVVPLVSQIYATN